MATPGNSSLEFVVKHGKTTEQAGPPWTFQGAYVVPCLWLLCMTSGWVILSMYGIDKVVGATSSIFAAIRRLNLLHRRLQVRPKNMSLLYRCRMASVFRLTVEHRITSSSSPSSWNQCDFLGKPQKAKWLVDMPYRILVSTDISWSIAVGIGKVMLRCNSPSRRGRLTRAQHRWAGLRLSNKAIGLLGSAKSIVFRHVACSRA